MWVLEFTSYLDYETWCLGTGGMLSGSSVLFCT